MPRLSHHLPLLRRIAWLAMLLPLVALSAVPSGMMPGKTDGGTLTLILCTAAGPREMTVDLGTGQPPPAKQGCPWALVQVALMLPEQAAQAAPLAVLPQRYVRIQPTDLLPATIPGPRTARAPPAFA